jgi:hypothetical protein
MRRPLSRSEPLDIGERHAPGMHVHAAKFGAAMQLRKHLAGIEQALFIEGAFEPLLLGEVDFSEHGRHEVALLDPNAVLARQHATHFDAQLENLRSKGLGALELAGFLARGMVPSMQ